MDADMADPSVGGPDPAGPPIGASPASPKRAGPPTIKRRKGDSQEITAKKMKLGSIFRNEMQRQFLS